MSPSFRAGLWRLADPKISLASFAGLFLGAAAAGAAGPISWGWLLVTIIGIFALEVAKNASGEVFDYDSGTDLAVRPEDRSPFSGGKRVLVEGLLSRGETWGIAVAGYLIAVVAGLSIVIWREPGVLWIGVAGTALAFWYHAPPFRLSYRGLGEAAVAVCYGPLVVVGTWLVQRQDFDACILRVSLPFGLLVAAFLIANEFPDLHADRVSGKRTLVVRLGPVGGGRLFAALTAGALLVAAAQVLLGHPWQGLLGLIAAVPAYSASRRLLGTPGSTADIIPAQAQALLVFLLYAAGTGLGLLLA